MVFAVVPFFKDRYFGKVKNFLRVFFLCRKFLGNYQLYPTVILYPTLIKFSQT